MKSRARNTKRVTNKKRRIGKTKRVKPVRRVRVTKRARPVRRRRTRNVRGSGKLDGKLKGYIENIRAGNAVEENCKSLIANNKYQKNKDKFQFKNNYGDIIKKCKPLSPASEGDDDGNNSSPPSDPEKPSSQSPDLEKPSSQSPQASSTTQDECKTDELIEQIQQILSNYKN